MALLCLLSTTTRSNHRCRSCYHPSISLSLSLATRRICLLLGLLCRPTSLSQASLRCLSLKAQPCSLSPDLQPAFFYRHCMPDMRLSRGPFHAVRPSPNGKLLALMTADLVLWVVSSDFSRSLSEFDIRASEAYQDASSVDDPFRSANGGSASVGGDGGKGGLGGSGVRAVQWCGNNTIALAFNDEVVMVGPFGDSIRYPYAGPTHLVGEVDGVRIIASDDTSSCKRSLECPIACSDQAPMIQQLCSSRQLSNSVQRAVEQMKVSEPFVAVYRRCRLLSSSCCV